MKLSKKIEIIIKIYEQCISDYEWYEIRRQDAEKEENNIRHEMEGLKSDNGMPPKSTDRARLATAWQRTLLTRRAAKHHLAINQPFADYIGSDAGRNALNALKLVLGKTRKAESDMENKTYTMRKTDAAPMNPVLQKSIDELINDWKRAT